MDTQQRNAACQAGVSDTCSDLLRLLPRFFESLFQPLHVERVLGSSQM